MDIWIDIDKYVNEPIQIYIYRRTLVLERVNLSHQHVYIYVLTEPNREI